MSFEVFKQNYRDAWLVGICDRNGDNDVVVAQYITEEDAKKKCEELNDVLRR